ALEKENAKKPIASKTTEAAKPKLSYNEQKELDNIETEIENLENTVSLKTKEINAINDNAAIMTIAADIDELKKLLDVKTNRWLELSDKAKG
ncbi:MAG: ABC transporter ATP-binding protein, partial [Sphingobacteriales bacterium]